jgi:RNA polymerase sigma-70 factor (ECF subfamily)
MSIRVRSTVPPGSGADGSPERLTAALSAARAGDEAAFREIYRAVQPSLLRYVRGLIDTDAEDVASEAWLQISRDIRGFEGDFTRFRAWAVTIARHRAIDHARHRSRRPQAAVAVDDLADIAAPHDTAAAASDAIATREAIRLIATLPPDQAEAVLLRVVVGLDTVSAGRLLGKRPGAVRTAAHRGLRRLAELLERRET